MKFFKSFNEAKQRVKSKYNSLVSAELLNESVEILQKLD